MIRTNKKENIFIYVVINVLWLWLAEYNSDHFLCNYYPPIRYTSVLLHCYFTFTLRSVNIILIISFVITVHILETNLFVGCTSVLLHCYFTFTLRSVNIILIISFVITAHILITNLCVTSLLFYIYITISKYNSDHFLCNYYPPIGNKPLRPLHLCVISLLFYIKFCSWVLLSSVRVSCWMSPSASWAPGVFGG